MAKWEKVVEFKAHEHPLQLELQVYQGTFECESCGESGIGPVYHCEQCKYDVHLDCIK